MKYKLHFTISAYTKELDTFPIPENENYDYWVSLIRNFIKHSDTIEIHCWNDEEDVIKEMAILFNGSSKIITEGKITVIKGSLTDNVSNYLLNESIKTSGRLKWFSIFLSKNNTSVFQSEHWGTEFFAPCLSEEDIAYIKLLTPTGTSFHQYK